MRKITLLRLLAYTTALVVFIGALALGPVTSAFAQDPGTPVSGDGVVPTEVSGNTSCTALGYAFGFKIDAQPTGDDLIFTLVDGTQYGYTTFHVGGAPDDPTNSVTLSSDGYYFDWMASLGIDAVIVKGGKDTNAYVYIPEDTADTGLASPKLDNGNLPAISHIELCYDYELAATKTANTFYTRTYTWDIAKSVSPAAHSGFAGQTFSSNYDVALDQTATDTDFVVSGEIVVSNPSPLTASFSVSDFVDGVAATVSCPVYTLAPWASTTCTYTANLATKVDGTNTATITSGTYGVKNATATADYLFGAPTTVVGYETVNVTDSVQGALGSASGDVLFEYSDDFACPADPAKYTNGVYSYEVPNTATINETGQTSSTKVTVTCYAPLVTKTAAGYYDKLHTWDVTKSVSPEAQSGFAGDNLPWTWTVDVSEAMSEVNYAVKGVISVYNPADQPMTVAVSDMLDDGTVASVDCGGSSNLTVAAGATGTCSYTAAPADMTATKNTATATLYGASFSSGPVGFGWALDEVLNGTASLTDLEIGLDATLTAGEGPWSFTSDDSHDCSMDLSSYVAGGSYSGSVENTAKVTGSSGQSDSHSAETAYTCYIPSISKTANGKYDEVHDWEVFKSAQAAQKKFAGQSASYSWTVRVEETTHGENYLVTGKITVVNPNPEDALVVSLNDALDDGSVATIGPCTNGTWVMPNLTVPAGQTAVCDYSVVPQGDLADFAFALPSQVTMSVTYPYAGGPSYFPVTKITGGGALDGTYEGWCIDQDHTINQNTNYTANVFSSYEALPAGLVEHPENFDLVNWIINQDFVGKSAGGTLGTYTYSDVQRAIWEFIDDSPFSTSGLSTWSQARVDQIKALALASGEGFEPTCGDFIAVVLQPVGGSQPITIAQVTFASIGVSCANSNVVTAVLNDIDFPASADILWTANPVNPTATLDDMQNPAWPITVSADQTFTYTDPQGYVCPSDPAAYAGDGIAPVYTDTNTAVISYTGGSKSATASTSVTCYAPVVTKDAAAKYDERHTWSITKSVTPESQFGYAGDLLDWTWTVDVSESSVDENFAVSGKIYVKNPAGSPGNMVVNVSDLLNDGTMATVDCGGGATSLTVAAGATGECTYTAAPAGKTATLNTATGKFNNINFTGTAEVSFVKTVINGTATVTDSKIGLNKSLTAGAGPWSFTGSGSHTCSLSGSAYGPDGTYSGSESNLATVTGSDGQTASDDAATSYVCKAGFADLLKWTNGVVDPAMNWNFKLYYGPDGYGKTEIGSGSTLNDADGVLEFGFPALNPTKTYTVCELSVPAGYTSKWDVDLNGDGIIDAALVPYNPDADKVPPEDVGNRCVDFGAGTTIPVTVGTTIRFQVDNQMPGGDPRTPGYWKNWNKCTTGNQQYTAAANGGYEKGFWLLEDVLDPAIGGGIVWDDILADTRLVNINTCQYAVEILDQRVVTVNSKVSDGKKYASDPARTLAMHMLAAQLNFGAGACTTQEVLDKALQAETLLDKLDFDGKKLGAYLTKSSSTDYKKAVALAKYLDEYNNGMYCGSTMP